MTCTPSTDAAELPSTAHIQTNVIDHIIARHSDLNALCRDIAILTIFAEFIKICTEEKLFPHHSNWNHQNYRLKNKLIEWWNAEMGLNVVNVEHTELTLTRHVQHSVFGRVFAKLSLDAEEYQKAKIKYTELQCVMNPLANMKPFLDSDGVLHVCGRLSKTKINFKRKHQIILPRRHYFTQLVIHHYHQKVGHSGPASTLGSVHTAYWISSGINTVEH